MTDMEDLTAELRAVRAMLGTVVSRLEDAERRSREITSGLSLQRRNSRLLSVVLLAVVLLGAAAYQNARGERDRICSTLRSGFQAYTVALIGAGEGEDRTPEQEEARARTIERFTSDLDRRLASCG